MAVVSLRPAVTNASELERRGRPRHMAPYYEGSNKLKHLAVLIGAADPGIGRAVAVLFAREGADISIVYRDSPENADLTRRCVEAEGQRCLTISGDAAAADFCTRAVDRTMQQYGRLDVLVNSATSLPGSYFPLTAAVLPHLRRGSSIINSGASPSVRALTKSLARSLLHRGIRVNAVGLAPPIQAGSDSTMEPEDVAPTYVFLAAPSCSAAITGMVLALPSSGRALATGDL